jgi:hypothetical protein
MYIVRTTKGKRGMLKDVMRSERKWGLQKM